MRDASPSSEAELAAGQAQRLQEAVESLFACCQTRIALQSERFDLPPAAMRALIALGETRYLAPGELGRRLGVTKSRVTALTADLTRRGLIERRTEGTNTYVTLKARNGKTYACTVNGGNLLSFGMTNPPVCQPR